MRILSFRLIINKLSAVWGSPFNYTQIRMNDFIRLDKSNLKLEYYTRPKLLIQKFVQQNRKINIP